MPKGLVLLAGCAALLGVSPMRLGNRLLLCNAVWNAGEGAQAHGFTCAAQRLVASIVSGGKGGSLSAARISALLADAQSIPKRVISNATLWSAGCAALPAPASRESTVLLRKVVDSAGL